MPVQYKERAGQPYRPSNGTEGEIFMGRYCYKCVKDDPDGDPCVILGNALCLDVEHEDYPKEWVFDFNGRPICTAFEDVNGKTEAPAYRCDKTLDLFSVE